MGEVAPQARTLSEQTGIPEASAPDRRFSPGLESLRGCAAAVVVAYHAFHTLNLGRVDDAYRANLTLDDPWTLAQQVLLALFNGPACVTLFFVLSGAVLALSLERTRRWRVDSLVPYWVRRGFRLYPLLVFAAVFAAVLQFGFFGLERFPPASTWFNAEFKMPAAELPRQVVANALGWSSSLNPPAWSIKVEILGSLIFPLLLALARRPVLAAVTAVTLAVAALLPLRPQQSHYMHVFTVCFFVGALIPLWGAPVQRGFARLPASVRIAALVAGGLAFAFSRRLLAPDTLAPGVPVLIETLVSGLVIALILHGPSPPFLLSGIARLLGRLSYSLYLLHLPVLFVVCHLALRSGIAPHSPMGALAFMTAALALTMALTLPLAWLTHRFVESPGQRIGRTLGSHRWAPALLTGGVVAAVVGAVLLAEI